MNDSKLEGALIGIGNPLLDISANVPKEFFEKYDIKPGLAILAETKHLPLYEDLQKNYKVEYIAGGACQNAMRATQWMIQKPGIVGYIGCVGDDENAKILKKAAGDVITYYLIDKKLPTGTCAVLIYNKERTLIANLGAAEAYKKEHFESNEIQMVLQKAKYFYAEGFFLTHSANILLELGKNANKNNKEFMMNISAPFLVEFFWDKMNPVLPFTDIIFANETEAIALGKKLNCINENIEEIALKLFEYPKENKKRNRIIIFTQGSNPTIVCKDGKISLFSPISIKPEEIVDTNGAGDSFVGGFLSQYIQGKSLEQCIQAGHYCAWECIQRSGCTFPSKPTFSF